MNKLKSIFGLKIDETDYATDITQFELTSDEADADAMTFLEYNQGVNRVWTLGVTAVFDGGSAGSLHDYLWENAGATVGFVIQPAAGISSPSNPQYGGYIRLPYRPDISVEANTDSTFEYEFEVVGQPSKFKDGEESDVFGNIFNEFF